MTIDVSDIIKPSIPNILLITLIAAVGIHFMKFLTAWLNVPGLKELFGSI